MEIDTNPILLSVDYPLLTFLALKKNEKNPLEFFALKKKIKNLQLYFKEGEMSSAQEISIHFEKNSLAAAKHPFKKSLEQAKIYLSDLAKLIFVIEVPVGVDRDPLLEKIITSNLPNLSRVSFGYFFDHSSSLFLSLFLDESLKEFSEEIKQKLPQEINSILTIEKSDKKQAEISLPTMQRVANEDGFSFNYGSNDATVLYVEKICSYNELRKIFPESKVFTSYSLNSASKTIKIKAPLEALNSFKTWLNEEISDLVKQEFHLEAELQVKKREIINEQEELVDLLNTIINSREEFGKVACRFRKFDHETNLLWGVIVCANKMLKESVEKIRIIIKQLRLFELEELVQEKIIKHYFPQFYLKNGFMIATPKEFDIIFQGKNDLIELSPLQQFIVKNDERLIRQIRETCLVSSIYKGRILICGKNNSKIIIGLIEKAEKKWNKNMFSKSNAGEYERLKKLSSNPQASVDSNIQKDQYFLDPNLARISLKNSKIMLSVSINCCWNETHADYLILPLLIYQRNFDAITTRSERLNIDEKRQIEKSVKDFSHLSQPGSLMVDNPSCFEAFFDEVFFCMLSQDLSNDSVELTLQKIFNHISKRCNPKHPLRLMILADELVDSENNYLEILCEKLRMTGGKVNEVVLSCSKFEKCFKLADKLLKMLKRNPLDVLIKPLDLNPKIDVYSESPEALKNLLVGEGKKENFTNPGPFVNKPLNIEKSSDAPGPASLKNRLLELSEPSLDNKIIFEKTSGFHSLIKSIKNIENKKANLRFINYQSELMQKKITFEKHFLLTNTNHLNSENIGIWGCFYQKGDYVYDFFSKIHPQKLRLDMYNTLMLAEVILESPRECKYPSPNVKKTGSPCIFYYVDGIKVYQVKNDAAVRPLFSIEFIKERKEAGDHNNK